MKRRAHSVGRRLSALTPTITVTLAVAVLLTGCDITIGGDEATQTVTEPAKTVTDQEVKRPKPDEPKPPPEPTGPTGVLGASSVGSVEVGMTSDEVEELFGGPDRKETVNFGQGDAPQIDWIWNLEDGDFRLQFETDGRTVTGYVSETAQLATASGATVGDSFEPIRQRYGDQLEESVIGEGIYLLSEGKPGTHPALSFTLDGDTITSISGGEFQPAGE